MIIKRSSLLILNQGVKLEVYIFRIISRKPYSLWAFVAQNFCINLRKIGQSTTCWSRGHICILLQQLLGLGCKVKCILHYPYVHLTKIDVAMALSEIHGYFNIAILLWRKLTSTQQTNIKFCISCFSCPPACCCRASGVPASHIAR